MTNLPKFIDHKLLVQALTHRSALNEKISQSSGSNERLEFLGDAVLELVTSDYLYQTQPLSPEGDLTAFRSSLVKTTTLAELAAEIGIPNMIYMSKGEEAGGGRTNPSLLADTLEAIIGAIYLDQGIDQVREFLTTHLFPKFKKIKAEKLYKDPKSLLQEVVQAKGFDTPTYQVINEMGPDHDKEFEIEVLVGDKVAAKGSGKSKQLAQQAAAKKALEKYAEE